MALASNALTLTRYLMELASSVNPTAVLATPVTPVPVFPAHQATHWLTPHVCPVPASCVFNVRVQQTFVPSVPMATI
jgi:hypothetical protein